MRLIVTFFWAFLLSQMLTYVISSMSGIPFNFNTGVILSVIFTVLVSLLASIFPNDDAHEKGVH
ncbi:YjzD family protein [Niallia sp. 01092]|uniref:YjzD family protein n=1 Tax=unclassified Niallia TaxID=2837522 RepID=UPI003FD4D904